MKFQPLFVVKEYINRTISEKVRKHYRMTVNCKGNYNKKGQNELIISAPGFWLNVPIDNKFYIVHHKPDPIKGYVESYTIYNDKLTISIHESLNVPPQIICHSLYNS